MRNGEKIEMRDEQWRVGSICHLSGCQLGESRRHARRDRGVGLLLPAWFGVQLAGLGGGKVVDLAGEVKEMGTDSTARPRRYAIPTITGFQNLPLHPWQLVMYHLKAQ